MEIGKSPNFKNVANMVPTTGHLSMTASLSDICAQNLTRFKLL